MPLATGGRFVCLGFTVQEAEIIIDKLLTGLPDVVRALAEPLAKVENFRGSGRRRVEVVALPENLLTSGPI